MFVSKIQTGARLFPEGTGTVGTVISSISWQAGLVSEIAERLCGVQFSSAFITAECSETLTHIAAEYDTDQKAPCADRFVDVLQHSVMPERITAKERQRKGRRYGHGAPLFQNAICRRV